ncbi:MAG TPA: hypothetical protein PKK10_01915 [Woeseiaceae bacterium]|nr:hypothetical protein [Woeseiaceae bacterium]
MTGERSKEKVSADIEEEIDTDDDVDSTLSISTSSDDDDDDDNIGDMSVEINIEELVAKLDATDDENIARRRAIKRRLEELRDMRDAEKDMDSTYNFNLDDD